MKNPYLSSPKIVSLRDSGAKLAIIFEPSKGGIGSRLKTPIIILKLIKYMIYGTKKFINSVFGKNLSNNTPTIDKIKFVRTPEIEMKNSPKRPFFKL